LHLAQHLYITVHRSNLRRVPMFQILRITSTRCDTRPKPDVVAVSLNPTTDIHGTTLSYRCLGKRQPKHTLNYICVVICLLHIIGSGAFFQTSRHRQSSSPFGKLPLPRHTPLAHYPHQRGGGSPWHHVSCCGALCMTEVAILLLRTLLLRRRIQLLTTFPQRIKSTTSTSLDPAFYWNQCVYRLSNSPVPESRRPAISQTLVEAGEGGEAG